MSRHELDARIREHNAMIHAVIVQDDSGGTAFWYECAGREAAEDDCDWMDAHGIEAHSVHGPRRMAGLDEMKQCRRKHARARRLKRGG